MLYFLFWNAILTSTAPCSKPSFAISLCTCVWIHTKGAPAGKVKTWCIYTTEYSHLTSKTEFPWSWHSYEARTSASLQYDHNPQATFWSYKLSHGCPSWQKTSWHIFCPDWESMADLLHCPFSSSPLLQSSYFLGLLWSCRAVNRPLISQTVSQSGSVWCLFILMRRPHASRRKPQHWLLLSHPYQEVHGVDLTNCWSMTHTGHHWDIWSLCSTRFSNIISPPVLPNIEDSYLKSLLT